MNAPPEGQKEAPRCVDARRRAKANGTNDAGTVGVFPRLVKATRGAKREGTAAPIRRPAERAPDGAAALPCLNSNNSNEPPLTEAQREGLNRLSTSHRKTAFALAHNVARLCSKYGIERIGFLTLTFAEHITCAKEAGSRFNSLRTGVLAERYAESICVLERMKSGRIHFHLLVVLAGDIRTGFNFAQAAVGVYSSANAALRTEWAFWRATAPRYRFGRTELMPVKSNEEGLSKYVGKYIAKHIGARETRDKGVRLVRYSSGANPCGTRFMFVSPRSRLWRWQVAEFARQKGCCTEGELVELFGSRWAYLNGSAIMAIEPPATVVATVEVDGEKFDTTMWDLWQLDRVARCSEVARAVGCTTAEAYCGLHQGKHFTSPTLEFTVSRWSGVKLNTPSDVTSVMWNEDRKSVCIQRVNDGAGPKSSG